MRTTLRAASWRGLPCYEMDGRFGKVTVTKLGAHVVSWIPNGQSEVLWVSQTSLTEVGKPIRGGIPICLPWFSTGLSGNQQPMHGTARIAEWEFDPVEELPEDLRFSHDLMVKEPWSEKTQPCTAGLSAQLEENKLVVNLGLLNNGDKAVQAEMMLHAYFLASIKKTTITGFEGRKYRNMVVDGYPTQTQTGPIGFPADHETSMLFLGQESKCSILDAEKRRRIGVESEGLSALVWNAGRKKAEGMPDFYSQHWDQTLCVETGGAKANSRAVQPGERWYYKTTYSINAL